MTYLPAPSGLHRGHFKREVKALELGSPPAHTPPHATGSRASLWPNNWLNIFGVLALTGIHFASQTESPFQDAFFTAFFVMLAVLFYVQLVVFVRSHKADKVLKLGKFAEIHLLLQMRRKEINTWQ